MAVTKCSKTGSWRFRVWATNPHTGEAKRLTGTSKLNTKRDAEKLEEIAIRTFQERDPSKPETIQGFPLLKDVALKFIAHLVANPELAESYTTKVELNFRLHTVPYFGDRRLSSITRLDLEEFKLALLRKPKLRGAATERLADQRAKLKELVGEEALKGEEPAATTLAPRTVKDILRCLHGLFVFAEERDMVHRIPRFPKPPKLKKKAPVFLTFEEEDLLYAAYEDASDRLAVMFAIRTGLRAGEQMLAEWSDIDFDHRTLTVRRAFKVAKTKSNVGSPKSGDDRVIFIDSDLTAALKAGRHLRGKLIFYKPDGQVMTHSYMKHVLLRGLRKAGIQKHVRWHDLRHTFGSHRAMLNTPLQRIQAWMGHSTITTTEIYAHLLPSEGKQALEDLEAERAKRALPETAAGGL